MPATMLLLEHTPRFDLADATLLAEKLYGLRATALPLPSERDQNFLLETESKERFVLKLANELEDRLLLQAQNEALAHLAHNVSICPRLLATIAGKELAEVTSPSGAYNFVRLVTYLPGTPLAKIESHSPGLLRDLGRRIAQVDRALSSFDHPAIHRNFHWDMTQCWRVIRDCAQLIEVRALHSLVEQLAASFERDVLPRLPT